LERHARTSCNTGWLAGWLVAGWLVCYGYPCTLALKNKSSLEPAGIVLFKLPSPTRISNDAWGDSFIWFSQLVRSGRGIVDEIFGRSWSAS
jgi:hypothetical protein